MKLIFEGCGCVPAGDLENCRIRTAFHDKEGRGVYLEINAMNDYCKMGYISDVFYTDDKNMRHLFGRNRIMKKYNKINVTRIVQKFNNDYDDIEVDNGIYGYRVFANCELPDRNFVFADEFAKHII